MASETAPQQPPAGGWQAKQVYVMAGICVVIGLAIGYFIRGSQSPAAVPAQAANTAHPGIPGAGFHSQMPTLEQMKHMADVQAAPLLEKVKSDPANSQLLFQVGNIYNGTHQFKDAITYYDKALKIDPKNVPIRTEMASCMYYTGDVDGAIDQLQQGLHYEPKDANSLFNLGMMKWQGKKDLHGALAAWQELLKTNPQLSADRKAQVQKLIADAQLHGKG